MENVNWCKVRNAIAKRVRLQQSIILERHDSLDDAIQEACGFAWEYIDSGVDVGLAIYRAVRRVVRGQHYVYEPAKTASWEHLPSHIGEGSSCIHYVERYGRYDAKLTECV